MNSINFTSSNWFHDAASRIKNGEVGLVPFDTVWGLVGKISPSVINRLFEIKQRPKDRPLLVVISDIRQLETLCSPLNDLQRQAIKSHWPGPTTLILPKHPRVPTELIGAAQGIAIRYPTAQWVLDLINTVGEPLISTSANRHGFPVPQTHKDWDPQITNACDFTASWTPPMTGTPSAIIDYLRDPPSIVRDGQ